MLTTQNITLYFFFGIKIIDGLTDENVSLASVLSLMSYLSVIQSVIYILIDRLTTCCHW
jgi:hypothetical protein